MNREDIAEFAMMLDGLAEYYQKDALGEMPVNMYFQALSGYSLASISQAVSSHLSDVKHGTFFPKVADIVRHLDGGEVTADMIVAAAKLAKTPLGCLARIKIGTWDLSGGDSYYLKQRAAECLLELPDWKERAKRGEYSDHEISVMLKYDVSPSAPFSAGLAAPPVNAGLIERATSIELSERHRRFIEPAYDPNTQSEVDIHPAVVAFLEKIK